MGEATQELHGSEMITRVPHPRDQRDLALTRWGSAHRLAPGDAGGPPTTCGTPNCISTTHSDYSLAGM